VACDGADVRTIEGYDDDALMARLRSAFTSQHALQCGYCTPGMLVAARDLIRRKGGLSRTEIRTEMSGNLCRCTGYIGIVNAIEQVMAERDTLPVPQVARDGAWLGPAPGPMARTADARTSAQGDTTAATSARIARSTAPAHAVTTVRAGKSSRAATRAIPVSVGAIEERDGATCIAQSFVLQHPLQAVWQLMSDPAAVARCMPGLSLDPEPAGAGSDPLPPEVTKDDPASARDRTPAMPLSGHLDVKLGPITASFAGEGSAHRIDAEHRMLIEGRGGDRKSGSRVSGSVDYRLTPADADGNAEATRVEALMSYTLAGPLAQLGRSALARDLVRRLGEAFAANLDAQLTDPSANLPAAKLGGVSLLLRVLADRLKAVADLILRTTS
jgi:carbon-monoxide dehydrogenase small subunit